MNHSATETTSNTVSYTTAEYSLQMLTPAFLGDADQNARWRTPPIKALLRQWWRVVWAAEHDYPADIQHMRHEEGLLFGHAWLENDQDGRGQRVTGRKSAIRIGLAAQALHEPAWTAGSQKGIKPLSDGLDTSYAWFGLVKRGGGLPDRTAIAAGDAEAKRSMKLAYPVEESRHIETVVKLIHDFGQLGSRSRGGWGALHIVDAEPLAVEELHQFTRPWQTCLSCDWPASFASDDAGLWLWQSRKTYSDWAKLMDFVARRRKEIRTSLKSIRGNDLRAVLGTATGNRLASPLRWRPVLQNDNSLRLRIFAMPWRVSSLVKYLSDEQLKTAWLKVAQELDRHAELQRYAK